MTSRKEVKIGQVREVSLCLSISKSLEALFCKKLGTFLEFNQVTTLQRLPCQIWEEWMGTRTIFLEGTFINKLEKPDI